MEFSQERHVFNFTCLETSLTYSLYSDLRCLNVRFQPTPLRHESLSLESVWNDVSWAERSALNTFFSCQSQICCDLTATGRVTLLKSTYGRWCASVRCDECSRSWSHAGMIFCSDRNWTQHWEHLHFSPQMRRSDLSFLAQIITFLLII